MKNRTSLLFVGPPSSGKTTFVAALWYAACESADSELTLYKHHGNETALSKLRHKWLRYEEVGRTYLGEAEKTSMLLMARNDQSEIAEVWIPDIAGEDYVDQFVNRSWTSEFDGVVETVDGVLLFVHPSYVVEMNRLDDANALLGAIPQESALTSGPRTSSARLEFKPKEVPTQVQMVDWLQMIESRLDVPRKLPVGVIISAWDLLANMGVSPASWLAERLPLLDQFLRARESMFPCRVFGVSAQGGDYATDLEALTELEATRRVLVAGEAGSPHDITAPVAWLLRMARR